MEVSSQATINPRRRTKIQRRFRHQRRAPPFPPAHGESSYRFCSASSRYSALALSSSAGHVATPCASWWSIAGRALAANRRQALPVADGDGRDRLLSAFALAVHPVRNPAANLGCLPVRCGAVQRSGPIEGHSRKLFSANSPWLQSWAAAEAASRVGKEDDGQGLERTLVRSEFVSLPPNGLFRRIRSARSDVIMQATRHARPAGPQAQSERKSLSA